MEVMVKMRQRRGIWSSDDRGSHCDVSRGGKVWRGITNLES